MVGAVEVRVLHQIQFVDGVDLLARHHGRCTADVMVMMVVVVVVIWVVNVLVERAVVDGQVQRHGVGADLVRRRGAAVQRHVRTAETVHRMFAGVRTCEACNNDIITDNNMITVVDAEKDVKSCGYDAKARDRLNL